MYTEDYNGLIDSVIEIYEKMEARRMYGYAKYFFLRTRSSEISYIKVSKDLTGNDPNAAIQFLHKTRDEKNKEQNVKLFDSKAKPSKLRDLLDIIIVYLQTQKNLQTEQSPGSDYRAINTHFREILIQLETAQLVKLPNSQFSADYSALCRTVRDLIDKDVKSLCQTELDATYQQLRENQESYQQAYDKAQSELETTKQNLKEIQAQLSQQTAQLSQSRVAQDDSTQTNENLLTQISTLTLRLQATTQQLMDAQTQISEQSLKLQESESARLQLLQEKMQLEDEIESERQKHQQSEKANVVQIAELQFQKEQLKETLHQNYRLPEGQQAQNLTAAEIEHSANGLLLLAALQKSAAQGYLSTTKPFFNSNIESAEAAKQNVKALKETNIPAGLLASKLRDNHNTIKAPDLNKIIEFMVRDIRFNSLLEDVIKNVPNQKGHTPIQGKEEEFLSLSDKFKNMHHLVSDVYHPLFESNVSDAQSNDSNESAENYAAIQEQFESLAQEIDVAIESFAKQGNMINSINAGAEFIIQSNNGDDPAALKFKEKVAAKKVYDFSVKQFMRAVGERIADYQSGIIKSLKKQYVEYIQLNHERLKKDAIKKYIKENKPHYKRGKTETVDAYQTRLTPIIQELKNEYAEENSLHMQSPVNDRIDDYKQSLIQVLNKWLECAVSSAKHEVGTDDSANTSSDGGSQADNNELIATTATTTTIATSTTAVASYGM